MRFVVRMPSKTEGRNYSNGYDDKFASPVEKAFIFDDDDPWVKENCEGDAFEWADGHRKARAKLKKKRLEVCVLVSEGTTSPAGRFSK